MTAAINKGMQKIRKIKSRDTADAFMDRNMRLLDKGIEAIKRERGKMYFG